MSIVIREALEEDVSILTTLMNEYIVGFYKKPWPGDEHIHALIQSLLKKQGGIQFIALLDDEIVGFATLYFTFSTMKANKTTIMNDLYVSEPYRDTEVEKQLFLRCQHYSRENGYSFMQWITATDNIRAQRFFDKMGAVQGNWVNYSIV